MESGGVVLVRSSATIGICDAKNWPRRSVGRRIRIDMRIFYLARICDPDADG
jgi:hypothetical protein